MKWIIILSFGVLVAAGLHHRRYHHAERYWRRFAREDGGA